ncbi:hypothetical protein HDU76_007936, partial [Blyttiomyces sp. JEL0837]
MIMVTTSTTTATTIDHKEPSSTAPGSASASSSSSSISLWDSLPFEIKEQILTETDAPTRFINNHPVTETEIRENAHDIWMAVINTNSWDRDLSVLPKASFPTILNGLDQVTSREVYHQLCKNRPNLDRDKELQRLIRQETWKDLEIWKFKYASSPELLIGYGSYSEPLLHIPMRLYWMDLLPGLHELNQLKLFYVAGSFGHFELFQHLYNNLFLNQHESNLIHTPSDMSLSDIVSHIIFFAAQRGYMNILQFLLTKFNIDDDNNKPVDIPPPPSKPAITLTKSITNYAIPHACKMGYLEIVKFLLTVPGVDPTALDNYAVREAAGKGHLEIVKFLLTVPGVDPTACDNYAVRNAASNGYLDVVKFLLTVPGIDAS